MYVYGEDISISIQILFNLGTDTARFFVLVGFAQCHFVVVGYGV